ncbi:MAG TPA: GlsB/YeaQ/YmgE family stress response membrane protein [Parachlamydiaceae bacterium]|nr:GlsB/YeaQ/YmgE family stress response membrane protein [Parachlamydiaceae bacterium]
MGLISTIFIGFIVGLFARALMPGRDVVGFIWTTLLGIGGAIVGKFIGQGIGVYSQDQSAGFFMSLLGATILLFIYNHFRKKNVV